MQVSQIIGPISWWLHASPALVGLSVVGYLLWISVMRERKINSHRLTKHLTIIISGSQYWRRVIQKSREKIGSIRIERLWVSSVVMVTSVIIVYASTRPPKYPKITEHNVAVLWRLADGDWMMESDEQGRFAYRPCNDFNVDPMLSQAIGFIAPVAKWEERGDCKSIREDGLGFWWRDGKGEFVKVPLE